MDHTCEAAAYC
ncbi:hypothetical protein A2U01_0085152, partial [Trifolium medium]|nr:hypothetical protein [Trifolium medium]